MQRPANHSAILSQLIVDEMQRNGGDVAKALDTVCGAGTFDKLASDVWHGLRGTK